MPADRDGTSSCFCPPAVATCRSFNAGPRLEHFCRSFGRVLLVLIDGGRAADLAATALARQADGAYFVVRLGTVETSEASGARDFPHGGGGCSAALLPEPHGHLSGHRRRGFIGSHLVEALVRRGDKVRVLDNFSTGKPRIWLRVADESSCITGDVCDEAAVARAVAGCEVVFHEAALASVPRSVADPLATMRLVRRDAASCCMKRAKAGVRRVVYAASSSAYGNQPQPQ